MKFEKYHALGNDYLVYDPENGDHTFTENEIIRICHRNFGLGSDGILVGPLPSNRAEFGLKILNPDGSEAEKSGNGLRFSPVICEIQIGLEPMSLPLIL